MNSLSSILGSFSGNNSAVSSLINTTNLPLSSMMASTNSMAVNDPFMTEWDKILGFVGLSSIEISNLEKKIAAWSPSSINMDISSFGASIAAMMNTTYNQYSPNSFLSYLSSDVKGFLAAINSDMAILIKYIKFMTVNAVNGIWISMQAKLNSLYHMLLESGYNIAWSAMSNGVSPKTFNGAPTGFLGTAINGHNASEQRHDREGVAGLWAYQCINVLARRTATNNWGDSQLESDIGLQPLQDYHGWWGGAPSYYQTPQCYYLINNDFSWFLDSWSILSGSYVYESHSN